MKKGNLCDLGVQDGDVVECVNALPYGNYITGNKYVVGGLDELNLQVRAGEMGSTFCIVSRAANAKPTPDLTAITTPFGLLDKATQEALRAHGGPYEYFDGNWWVHDPDPMGVGTFAVRVKPAPKVETVTENWHLDGDGFLYSHTEIGTPVRVTFTRTNGVIDLNSYKVEAR